MTRCEKRWYNTPRLGKRLPGAPSSGKTRGWVGLALAIVARAAMDLALGGAVATEAQLFLDSDAATELVEGVLAEMGYPQAAGDLLRRYREGDGK